MEEEKVKCPKCGSTQLSANQKGWSVMWGPVGSGKIKITCLKCGYVFRPGQTKTTTEEQKDKLQEQRKQMNEQWSKLSGTEQNAGYIILAIVVLAVMVLMMKACN